MSDSVKQTLEKECRCKIKAYAVLYVTEGAVGDITGNFLEPDDGSNNIQLTAAAIQLLFRLNEDRNE